MALNDRKITGWAQPIVSLDDKPKLTAAALKAAFDSNSNELKPAVNGMIDDLTGTGGAGEIGTSPVEGVSGTTVQAMLAALKAMIDLCETQAGSAAALALKADKATVAKLVETVAFNAQTGVFTITEQGGTVHEIDTVLEKVPMSCRLDGQDFVLTLEDGTEQRVSLAAFLTPQEFVNSGSVEFHADGGTVTAAIKAGGVTSDMLESTIMGALTELKTAAETAAANAAASEQNAADYRAAAAGSAQTAVEKAAESGSQAALAQSYAVGGTGTRTGEDTDNAKHYRDQALLSATQAGTQAGAASAEAARAEAAARGMGVHIGADRPGNSEKIWLKPVDDPLIMNPNRATADMTQEVAVDGDGRLVTKPTTMQGTLPIPTEGDVGKVPAVNAANSAYTLKKVYSKSEADVLLAGKADQPYASAEGAFIHIADSAGGMLAGLRIYGKSIQNGTPNWDNPVPIESAGAAGTVTVTLSDSADNTQTITLQTPGGLLGLPVSSGGNYIDEAGQRWVCDEVDLARGVYVQRVAKHVVTGDEAWEFQVAGNGKRVFSSDFYKKHPWDKINKNSYDVMSNCCVTSESIDVTSKTYKYSDNIFIYGDFDSVDAFKALAKAKYDAGNPLILHIGILPVERRLTSEEIAAYKALVTYDGTTVVQADGAGIQIVYRQTVIFRGSELLADVTISGLQELHIRSIDCETGVMELTEPLTIGSDGATLPGGFGGWGLGVDITKLQSLKNSVPKELLQKFGSYFDAVKRVDETHIQIPAFSSFTEPSALDLNAFWIAKSALVTLTDLPEFERLRFHVSTNGGTCSYIRLYDEGNSVIYGYCGVQSGTYGSYNTRIPAVSASGLGVSEGVLDGNSTLVLSGRSLGFNAAGSFVSTLTEQNYAVFDREKKVKKIEIRAEYGQMLNGSRVRVWKEA